jgi:hypothetical protein
MQRASKASRGNYFVRSQPLVVLTCVYMNTDDLAAALQEPELHRRILKGYRGPYSLGVTTSPESEGDAVLVLHIGDEAPPEVSQEVTINGERVPVIVKRGFLAPKAQ